MSEDITGILGDSLTLRQKLNIVQGELKVPKNQRNSFGNYNYRSCEDILEAVKPLLAKYGIVMTISDKIVNIGDRYYVESTVKLREDIERDDIEVSAYARESLLKKGMDEAQITGAASSYARKYALNGMFLIDDTKDADTMDNREKTPDVVENAVDNGAKCPKCGADMKKSSKGTLYCSALCWKK